MRRTRALVIVVWVAGCAAPVAQTQLANLASQRCVAAGGAVQIEKRPDGKACDVEANFAGNCS